MNFIILPSALAAVLCLAAPQAATNSAKDDRLCSVHGSVTDKATEQGLRKAYLRLSGKNGSYSAVSDAAAKFIFDSVEPGTYLLEAEHHGYLDSESVQIKLVPKQVLTDLQVQLMPQAVLSGRVLNEEGDPWTHAGLRLFRSGWSHGKRNLSELNAGFADEEGEFRIAELPPGRYYLLADPDSNWELRNNSSSKDGLIRQPTWYPNAVDVGSATPIVVSAGGRIAGLQIQLRRGLVNSIRGTVSGLDTLPAAEQRGSFSRLGVTASIGSDPLMNPKSATIHSDGSFEIKALPSGFYQLRISQGIPPVYLGMGQAQVNDQDVNDVSIQITLPRVLNGILRTEEKNSMNTVGLNVHLESILPGWGYDAVSQSDGSFSFPKVESEKFRVSVMGGAGQVFYLKEVRYADIAANDGIVFVSGAGGLELLVSPRACRLMGSVVRATGTESKHAGKIQLVLLPEEGLPQLGTFDQTFTFAFENLKPGKYSLYAFEDLPEGVWADAEFLKEVADSAAKIDLAEGDVKNLDVHLATQADLAPTLKKLGIE